MAQLYRRKIYIMGIRGRHLVALTCLDWEKNDTERR